MSSEGSKGEKEKKGRLGEKEGDERNVREGEWRG